MAGTLRKKELSNKEQFTTVNDQKLRMTLTAMSNRYSDRVRTYIYHTYNDPHIMSIYRAIRNSGVYEHGSKDKVRRKIVEYPSGYVYDFIKTVMLELYGPEWYKNNKALNHELVKPWWVVNKL